MKSWETVTARGRARRLRPLIDSALREYGLTGARVRMLAPATSMLFRVDSAAGASFVLKIEVEEIFPDRQLDIAFDWLEALHAETDLPLVELVKTIDGRRYTYPNAEFLPPSGRCSLYRWLAGKTMFDAPSADLYWSLGRITAQLHHHAASYRPSGEPLRWDQVFYYPLEPPVFDRPEYAARVSARQRSLIERCVEVVSPILSSLYAQPARLIHGDLHGWNAVVSRGQLTILDFDDVMLGQPIHDVAIAMSYHRAHADYPSWIAAYEEGYRTVARWPVTSRRIVEALFVARQLLFTNHRIMTGENWSSWATRFEAFLRDEAAAGD